jgi:hypothetical protein
MTIRRQGDQGFDDFRKERKRIQAKVGRAGGLHDFHNQALRELEQAEEREVREQQLTREVHDFFAAATRQAASIVDRVARDAEREAGQRIEQEMEAFLIDSLARMNTLVLAVLKERRGAVAETRKEPSVGNLVGPLLDEFRSAGTADVGDKHVGQDPFATAVDDVQREFRAQVTGAGEAEQPARPIEQHLVAALASGEPASAVADDAETPAEPAPAAPPAPAEGPRDPGNELERFKAALKEMVRQGVMSRDEARAAWQVRLRARADGA